MEQEKFTRKELYHLVWENSLLSLSKKYEISDNGLRKICKRMNIPLPTMGYWQKVKRGRSVMIKSLPRDNSGQNDVILRLRKQGSSGVNPTITPLRSLIEELENDPALPIRVSDRLTNPDKLIITAGESLKKSNNQYNIYKGFAETNTDELSIRVGKEQIPRALRFFDSLIKLLRSRNHTIHLANGRTYAVIEGEQMRIILKEKVKIIRIPHDTYKFLSDTEYHPTGVLTFQMEGYKCRKWIDGKKKLEEKLVEILAVLELEAKEMIKVRLYREEQHRIWEEQERIKREEKERKERELARFNELMKQANQWNQALILRNFIKAVEAKMLANGNPTSENRVWLEWAKAKAETIDPINSF